MGAMVKATKEKISQLTDPDGALVALAINIAGRLDDPDSWTAAGAKVYHQVMTSLIAAHSSSGPSLDDLDGDD